MGLKRIGVELVADGQSTFKRALVEADTVMGSAGRAAKNAASGFDKMGDQAKQAARQIGKVGKKALETAGSIGLFGAAMAGVGLLAFAAAGGVVAASILAINAAAALGPAALAGFAVGFGVFANATSEAKGFEDQIKATTNDLDKLKKKGITTGPEVEALKKQLSDLNDAYRNTFVGMGKTLLNWAQGTSMIISKPVFEELKVQLRGLVKATQEPEVQDAVGRLATKVQEGLDRIKGAFGGKFDAGNFLVSLLDKAGEGVDKITKFATEALPVLGRWWDALKIILTALGGPVAIYLALLGKGLKEVNTESDIFGKKTAEAARIFDFFGKLMASAMTIVGGLLRGVLSGLIPFFDKWAAGFNGVTKQAGGFEAFLKQLSDGAFKVGEFIGGAIGHIIDFGIKMGEFVGKTIGFLSQFEEPLKSFLGFFAPIAPGLQDMAAGFTVVAGGAKLLMPIFSGLGPAIGLLTNPIGLVAAAIAALAIAWVNDFGGIRTFTTTVIFPFFRSIGDFVVNVVGGAFKFLWDIVSGTWNGISGVISGTWGGIRNTFTGIMDFLSNTFGGAWTTLKQVVGGAWDGIRNGISTAWELIKGTFTTIIDFIKNTLGAAWDGMASTVRGAFSLVKRIIGGAANVFIKILNAILWAINKAIWAANNLGGWMGVKIDEVGYVDEINLDKMANGGITKNVPTLVGEEGPELIMPGAGMRVLTAAQTRKLLSGLVAPVSPVAAPPTVYNQNTYSYQDNWNLGVNTSNSPDAVIQNYAIMRAMAGGRAV